MIRSLTLSVFIWKREVEVEVHSRGLRQEDHEFKAMLDYRVKSDES